MEGLSLLACAASEAVWEAGGVKFPAPPWVCSFVRFYYPAGTGRRKTREGPACKGVFCRLRSREWHTSLTFSSGSTLISCDILNRSCEVSHDNSGSRGELCLRRSSVS